MKKEIIELALSDHASFDNIRSIYGIGEKDVKKLMRENLKSRSYKSWRKRVREFSDRRKNINNYMTLIILTKTSFNIFS